MAQTPKLYEPLSGSRAAVENGIVVPPLDAEGQGPGKPDIIEVLLVLAREKRPILLFTVGVAVLAMIVAFLLPKMYTATTTILPPQQKQSALNLMLGQIGVLSKLGGASDLGLQNPADLFVAMLTSRTIEDNLINRFDLRKIYRVKRYQDARRKLNSNCAILAEKEGLIFISVTD